MVSVHPIFPFFHFSPVAVYDYVDISGGFPGASLATSQVQWLRNHLPIQEMQETWVQYLGWEDSLR